MILISLASGRGGREPAGPPRGGRGSGQVLDESHDVFEVVKIAHLSFTNAPFSANLRKESERRSLDQSGTDLASIKEWSRSTYLRPRPNSRWNRPMSSVFGLRMSWSGLRWSGSLPTGRGCLKRPITWSSARLSAINQH